jgi:hypothetical protein
MGIISFRSRLRPLLRIYPPRRVGRQVTAAAGAVIVAV